MLSCHDVADYFLAVSRADEEAGDPISNMTLQKLLYYAQGFYLALNDKPLFNERIEAWTHGPVVPDVYHRFKQHGAGPLPMPAEIDLDRIPDHTAELLDEVYKVYGQFSGWKLREMTHAEPPWAETQQGGAISRNALSIFFKTRIVDGEGEEP
ncbi:MAG TPA: type II toxin-antitoxin system antitoxin SocA domain-containing protein [Pirellulales bacterium]|nr:type II toxin-antitoxin system antitoxin SocA domain-containing protein [Pirellulales bacterium]